MAVKKTRKKVADKPGREKKKLPPDHWEVFLLKEIISHNIPVPDREYRFSTTRRWRFDLAWPHLALAVEVEGGIYRGGRHVTPVGYEKDCEKYTSAAVDGWTVIRVTPNHIKEGKALMWIKEGYIKKRLERADVDEDDRINALFEVNQIRKAFGEEEGIG